MRVSVDCRQCTYSNWSIGEKYPLWSILYNHRKAVQHTEFMVTLSGMDDIPLCIKCNRGVDLIDGQLCVECYQMERERQEEEEYLNEQDELYNNRDAL
jgi:hypothetical protein